MSAQSIPVNPPQPNQPTYQPRDLETVKQYTREDYVAAFGENPPPPLANIAQKNWFDTSDATKGDGDVTYYRIDPTDGKEDVTTMPKAVARRVNIAGKGSYPPYVPPPTPAINIVNGVPNNADPSLFCTIEERDALVKETGATGYIDGTPDGGGGWGIQLNGETRREWRLKYADGRQPPFGGQLLSKKYQYGYGAPVKLDPNAAVPPNWILADANESVAPGDPYWVPQRELLANERVLVGLMGVQIERTDMIPVDPNPPTSGGLTAEEHQWLKDIHDWTKPKGVK